MPKKCKLLIFPKAQYDMDSIFDYISNILLNPIAALKLINDIQQSLLNICYFPESCPLINNEMVKDQSLRKLIVNNYIVFYRLKNNEVQVIRVLYGMINYSSIL